MHLFADQHLYDTHTFAIFLDVENTMTTESKAL